MPYTIVVFEMIPKEWLKGNPALNKELWEPLVVPAIVILVGISAFALGRLSAMASQEPITSAIVGK